VQDTVNMYLYIYIYIYIREKIIQTNSVCKKKKERKNSVKTRNICHFPRAHVYMCEEKLIRVYSPQRYAECIYVLCVRVNDFSERLYIEMIYECE
jgi:hypothetical protein